MELDPRYLKGIELFNAREFFDAHETWEELWHETQGEAKNFIQALIQAATALHHFQNSNLKGAKLLYDSFRDLISPYPDKFLDTNKKKLTDEMNLCFQGLAPYAVEDLPGRYSPQKEAFPIQLENSKIPTIQLFSSPDAPA